MKKLKKVLGVILATGCLSACVAGIAAADTVNPADFGASYLEGIKSKGTLVVGCDPTIENIIYLDPVSGEVVGFIPEIINGFAEGIGCTVQWETLEWSAMLTAVNNGNVDMIAANMNMTLERASQIVFSEPYFVDHAEGMVMNDSEYQSLADLDGKAVKIGVTEGGAYEAIVPDLFPSAEVVTLAPGTWLDALMSGIIDVAFDDGVVLAGPLSRIEDLRLLEGTGPSYLNGCAFAAGNYVTRDVFDLYIKRLKVNGTYGEIYAKYMGKEWTPDAVTSAY